MKLLKVLSSLRDNADTFIVNPRDYISAASEVLGICACISWLLAIASGAEHIKNNPLKDRLGYNNVCVAWDAPPAIYVAPVFFVFIAYLVIRYVYFDQMLCNLDESMPVWKNRLFLCVNVYLAFAFIMVILIFVVDPFVNATIHSCLFMNIMVAVLSQNLANAYQSAELCTLKTKVYLAVLSVDTFGFLLCAVIQLGTYDETTKTRGPIPWFVVQTFDILWFICVFVGGKFMPDAGNVQFVCSYVAPPDTVVGNSTEEVHLAGN